jgi:hypothetical protein
VRIPAAITNIAIPALSSKSFTNVIAVLLSIPLRSLRIFRSGREGYTHDLSEDEFFNQQRGG